MLETLKTGFLTTRPLLLFNVISSHAYLSALSHFLVKNASAYDLLPVMWFNFISLMDLFSVVPRSRFLGDTGIPYLNFKGTNTKWGVH